MSDEPKDAVPDELGSNARIALEQFIERIERLDAERAATSEDIKAAYAEAAGSGFDKKALKQIIKERSKADMDKTIKHRVLVDLYRRALAKSDQGDFGDWARGWISREAKSSIDKAKSDTADPKLADFLKARKARDRTGDRPGGGDAA